MYLIRVHVILKKEETGEIGAKTFLGVVYQGAKILEPERKYVPL